MFILLVTLISYQAHIEFIQQAPSFFINISTYKNESKVNLVHLIKTVCVFCLRVVAT